MEKAAEKMKELVEILTKAGRAYYQNDTELMSNLEYDRYYDELLALEKETGMVLSGSPTVQVGYESVEELPKERHASSMLSLDKTKDVAVLQDFVANQQVLLSWKLDGLTVVLTYLDGKLAKAVTRGNGEIGEVITPNARVFENIPLTIPYQGELILRGEAVISYSDFERINAEIPEADSKYKNPRNLCSGSVRQLNSEITAKRHVQFLAFSLVKADGVDFENSRDVQFQWLKNMGFSVVEYVKVVGAQIPEEVRRFSEKIKQFDIPSDGLVVLYDDIAYGQSLGRTAKFPRDSMAFKWEDETRETTLIEIEWSPSRTGLINPVAIFEPVELEGTTVSRASVHNISILKQLQLGIGDRIMVYKANMIIPQIAENLTRSGACPIPAQCPVCTGKTQIKCLNDVETLYCMNPKCTAKKLKAFALLVSRDALNMDGMSEATLEKLIGMGLIHSFSDLFHLDLHEEAILFMEGFGEKSYQNLIASMNRARNTTLPRLIYGLGIPNIGLSNAKMICRQFHFELEPMLSSTAEKMAEIDGIGEVIANSWVDYFCNKENREQLESLLGELTIEKPEESAQEQKLSGVTFVITGSVHHFSNRNEVKTLIESLGGKVTTSVTSKTQYLINNDVTSSSSKNKKARELGIPILSEEDFLILIGEETREE